MDESVPWFSIVYDGINGPNILEVYVCMKMIIKNLPAYDRALHYNGQVLEEQNKDGSIRCWYNYYDWGYFQTFSDGELYSRYYKWEKKMDDKAKNMVQYMRELNQDDIDMSRVWVTWNDGVHSQPVAKTFLSRLLDEAERGIKARDRERKKP